MKPHYVLKYADPIKSFELEIWNVFFHFTSDFNALNSAIHFWAFSLTCQSYDCALIDKTKNEKQKQTNHEIQRHKKAHMRGISGPMKMIVNWW